VCSLSHLHPFRFALIFEAVPGQPARVVTINVGFSCHVFTQRIEHAGRDPELYSDDRETRAFDMKRYEWSRLLGPIVLGLERRKCYVAGRENFVTLELRGTPPDREYRVFFTLRRHDARTVELIVQSAYLGTRDQAPAGQWKKQVRFRVLVSKALSGRLAEAR
jgi:hypothetical protein